MGPTSHSLKPIQPLPNEPRKLMQHPLPSNLTLSYSKTEFSSFLPGLLAFLHRLELYLLLCARKFPQDFNSMAPLNRGITNFDTLYHRVLSRTVDDSFASNCTVRNISWVWLAWAAEWIQGLSEQLSENLPGMPSKRQPEDTALWGWGINSSGNCTRIQENETDPNVHVIQ